MLKYIQKWFALRSYVKSLGKKLRERYGSAKKYTLTQVKATIEECGYSVDWMCYALCMYCDYADFMDYHRAMGEPCDYLAMRIEVADRFFQGDASFDVSDVIDVGSGRDSGDSPSEHQSWDDNGGEAGDFSSHGDSSDASSFD